MPREGPRHFPRTAHTWVARLPSAVDSDTFRALAAAYLHANIRSTLYITSKSIISHIIPYKKIL